MPARKPRPKQKSPAKRLAELRKVQLTLVSGYNDIFRGVVISVDEESSQILGSEDRWVKVKVTDRREVEYPYKRWIRFELPKGTKLTLSIRNKMSKDKEDIHSLQLYQGDTYSYVTATVFRGNYEIFAGLPLDDEEDTKDKIL